MVILNPFDLIAAIPLLPLMAFLITLFAGQFTPSLLPKRGAIPGILALSGSLLISLSLILPVYSGDSFNKSAYLWAKWEVSDLHFGFLIDPLSALMLVIVSLISLLVFIHSLGYMNDQNEQGLFRYYAGLSLFSFSMLSFVISDNLLMSFIFFELIGFCSWILIGFWFREDAPPRAATKAFLVTRFGDYFFLIGVVAVLVIFGTANFAGPNSFPVLAKSAILLGQNLHGLNPQTWVTIIGLLILGGVVGKSAQFPLHTWLPDAMEGPTPVSALIHAATMVAAGVYLVARIYGFYALSPTTLAVIALIGGLTALLAATMATVKHELKQVLAYSTISQYGYIMLSLGAGGYVAGIFHLTTHAIFKALLFLGAGAVIIAMHHDGDMWNMGGLREKLPITYWSFVFGSLALAGIFPFAGFWSKDEVLLEALNYGLGGSPILLLGYVFGLMAVFVTGFYTFRMVSLTFHGSPRSKAAKDPHSIRWNIKLPLVVLGILSLVAGAINMVPLGDFLGSDISYLHHWLDTAPLDLTAHHYHELLESFSGYHSAHFSSIISAILSLTIALSGMALAWKIYESPNPTESGTIYSTRFNTIYHILTHNYYQDDYQLMIANLIRNKFATVANLFDQKYVDGLINKISSTSLSVSNVIRKIQTGVVTNYVFFLSLGLLLILFVFAVWGGWF